MGVKKTDKDDKQENYIKNMINKGKAITAMLNDILWNRQITRKTKLQIYNSIVKSIVAHGAETWKLKKNLESKLMSMEMDFCRDRRDTEDQENIEIELLEKK